MSKKEEEEESNPAKKYDKLDKHKDAILKTTQRHHIEAFYHAEDEVLRGGDKKAPPDYEKLREDKHQLAFVDKMTDYYVERAQDYFSTKKDLGDLEKEMLMNAYSGVTKTALRAVVSKEKDKYEINKHKQIADNLLREIDKTLTGATRSHLSQENVGNLLKGTGAETYLAPGAVIELDEAVAIHDTFKENGAISRKMLEDILPKYKLKKAA